MPDTEENKLSRKEMILNWLCIRSGQYTSIAERTGVNVTWIYAFKAGKIPNPGTNQIDALYDFMIQESKDFAEFLKEKKEAE